MNNKKTIIEKVNLLRYLISFYIEKPSNENLE